MPGARHGIESGLEPSLRFAAQDWNLALVLVHGALDAGFVVCDLGELYLLEYDMDGFDCGVDFIMVYDLVLFLAYDFLWIGSDVHRCGDQSGIEVEKEEKTEIEEPLGPKENNEVEWQASTAMGASTSTTWSPFSGYDVPSTRDECRAGDGLQDSWICLRLQRVQHRRQAR